MQMDIAPDGRIFFIERAGVFKVWLPSPAGDATSGKTVEAGRLAVGLFGEVGLMGFVLSHDFATNPRAFVLYCPQDNPGTLRVSALPISENRVDIEAEVVLLEYPIDKDFAVHMGGGLAVSECGELFIGTGDNTIPIPELPLDERDGNSHLDARRSSANTNDLRGKILRIFPRPDSGYDIPSGNLFPNGEGGRPEIYAMGCRNPFRIAYDHQTGTIRWGDVGPNISMDVPIGPNGYDEFNATDRAGNFGWPFCVGPNEAYRDYDFETKTLGERFDPERLINDSVNNSGATVLPPAQPALIWYPSTLSEEFPELGAGGRSAMAGPIYRVVNRSDDRESPLCLPDHYDGAWLVHDWTRNWIKAVWLDNEGNCQRIEPFMPGTLFRKPIHLKLANDGTLYVLEFGDKWFDNRDAQIVRIVYRRGNRAPRASLTTSELIGKAPLTTVADASATVDPDGDEQLTWKWFVDGSEQSDIEGPIAELTLDERGVHRVECVVADPQGGEGRASLEVSVGNARPTVSLAKPKHGAFFDWATVLKYSAAVSDEEDGNSARHEIADNTIVVRADYQQRRLAEGEAEQLPPGLALMKGSTCFSCHATDAPGGGPAYRRVAEKYVGKQNAIGELAEKIVNGGAGVWGAKAMPAHPQHTVDEAVQMVTWVLGVDTNRTHQVAWGHNGAFLSPTKPPHRGDAGVLVIRAGYRDLGAEGVGSAAGEATAVLHSKRKKPAFCDASQGVDIVDVFEGGEAMTGFFTADGYSMFRDMRLDTVRAVRVRGQALASGAILQIRRGSVDGPLISEVLLPSDTLGEVETSFPTTTGLHDVVLVAKAPPGQAGHVASVVWIEFLTEAITPPATKVVVTPMTPITEGTRTQLWADLVARCVNQLDDAVAIVSPDYNWPSDQHLIADSRVVVLVRERASSGSSGEIPAEVQEQVDLMQRLGVGVVFLELGDLSAETLAADRLNRRIAPVGASETAEAYPFADTNWPVVTVDTQPWMTASGADKQSAMAWAEAPPAAGRRVWFNLPGSPEVLLESPVRDAVLRAVLWTAWKEPNDPPETWIDPTLVVPSTPVGGLETAAGSSDSPSYDQPIPGGYVLPVAASTSVAEVDGVFWMITAVALGCGIPITLAMCGLVYVYRHRDGHSAQPSPHHDARLEAAWSIVPAIVVVYIFHAGVVSFLKQSTPPDGCFEIGVRAQKWNWAFVYPSGYVDPDLHVPAGKPVKLVMSSADVIHSVYIPAFRLKADCVPGRYSTAWFEAIEPTPPGASHQLYCAEYCGTSHSGMLASVVVHKQEDFDEWLTNASDLTRTLPPVEAGKLLYQRRGCRQCHSADGSRLAGGGPSFLNTYGTEQSLADGATVTVDENYIRESVLNPMAKVRAGYRPIMPSYQGQLRDNEIDAIIAYLKSLAGSDEESDAQ